MRSISGFSGSAVLVYWVTPGTLSLFTKAPPDTPFRTLISKYWVLGVDSGHLLVPQRIWENGQSTKVFAESSMAGVVPAWKLTEILRDDPRVSVPRVRVEEELADAKAEAATPIASSQPELARYAELRATFIPVPKEVAQEEPER